MDETETTRVSKKDLLLSVEGRLLAPLSINSQLSTVWIPVIEEVHRDQSLLMAGMGAEEKVLCVNAILKTLVNIKLEDQESWKIL